MDCLKFQQLVSDFIFDKIDNPKTIEEFIEHSKTCDYCKDELYMYYSIHRGLGDVMAPNVEEDFNTDYEKELDNIFSFYEDYFAKERIMKRAGKVSIIAGLLVAFLTALYLFLKFAN